MVKKLVQSVLKLHRHKLSWLIFTGVLLLSVAMAVKFDFTNNYEGIFLLKGKEGKLLEVKDDLLLNEGGRYIAGIDLEGIKGFFDQIAEAHALTIKEPSLYFEWNDGQGEGFVRNYLPKGRQVITFFSRFVDEQDKEMRGLFVGGGLPGAVREGKMNETGMAYYDGSRWYHIWCSTNETIMNSRLEPVAPDVWKFVGSRVMHHNLENLIIESEHEMSIDGVPLRMTRTAYFKAGEPYFALTIRISNAGARPTTYYYMYGDEPWLGNYGTSGGNVGWAADGLHKYVEWLDTKKTHYAGLFDYGNDAIGESHTFTFTANFIDWLGGTEPSFFLSNGAYYPQMKEIGTPLSGNARFIGLNWGPRTLQPGQEETFVMAIGMAGHDVISGMPMLPKIDLANYP